jgi:RHS repeat-associated protein
VVAVTNETGQVIERMAYDAWGKRRFTDGTSDNKDSLVGLTTDRGYTEHEMLDELGIIHMNGRIYDPYIGRFMSADPIIQDLYELQSHNRYSYVMNNPLFYTDPSGYSAWNRFRDNVLKPVVVIAVTYYTGNVFGTNTLFGAIMSGAAGGATSALLNGGNFKQVLQGAAVGGLSSALFYGAGKIGIIKSLGGEYGIGHYAAHAAAGCVSTVAGGGQCGAGAASAVIGKAVTQFTSGNYWNDFTRGVAVSVGGGLASVAGGGTFANGATTAAYGYLFNACTRATLGCGMKWVANYAKGVLGIATMATGASLCTTGVGCAASAILIPLGGSNTAEAVDWFVNGDEKTNGKNPIKALINRSAPGSNVDLAFAAAEVVGAGAALKAPKVMQEFWAIAPHIKTLPGIPIVRPAFALPGATAEAAGAAWDSVNGSIDQWNK